VFRHEGEVGPLSGTRAVIYVAVFLPSGPPGIEFQGAWIFSLPLRPIARILRRVFRPAISGPGETSNQPNKNRMKKTILTIASACTLATSAYAGPTYNEFIAEWIRPDFNVGGSGDGVGLSATYSPMEHLYFSGTAMWAEVNNVDMNQYSIGVGGYYALIPDKLHIAADVGAIWQDVDGFNDDTSIYINPHFRWTPHEKFEVRVGGTYTDFDNEDWSWYGRVIFNMWENMDLTASYTDFDNYDIVSAGVRFRF
jgi:hypothetical protein